MIAWKNQDSLKVKGDSYSLIMLLLSKQNIYKQICINIFCIKLAILGIKNIGVNFILLILYFYPTISDLRQDRSAKIILLQFMKMYYMLNQGYNLSFVMKKFLLKLYLFTGNSNISFS